MANEGVSDQELVRRARTGDEVAYGKLVDRYLRPALAVAWEFTETIEDAEDVVQDAFGRVLSTIESFDARRPFRPWFFTILRNVARNAARARSLRVHQALEESLPDEAPSPLEQVERAELQALVDLRLESLPQMQRTCFRLCVLEGITSTEVAEALGVSGATVRTHVYRARQVMREAVQQLKEEAWDR